MEIRDYTLMLVGDERSPVRRIHLPARHIQRAIGIAAALALLFTVGLWDYWRMRSEHGELGALRIEAAEQREQIRTFEETLATVKGELARVKELERKVRIIANLPGAAAAGGEDVTELAPPTGGDLSGQGDAEVLPPAGVPVEVGEPEAASSEAPPQGQGGGEGDAAQIDESLLGEGLATPGARRVRGMNGVARALEAVAEGRAGSLQELVSLLEEKRNHLASMPSIWPARGWLTSRYGYRISPFTGRRQMHAGIDIAARLGTPVFAPAHGRVRFVGRKGPLGNALVLDHGYGVQTVYGHTSKIFVKIGDEVARGEKIAAIGSTGRSTGPHLHYAVEVNGKTRNPLNYIFD
jgi:murein DD-endopeptidase MepM/ murein hydrolase activator NlpD